MAFMAMWPVVAVAQPIDLSAGGPVEITSLGGLEVRDQEQVAIASGDARATRGNVMRIFLLCGASVGVLGTTIGFLLGLVFCLNIESIRQFIQMLSGTELFSAEIYFLTQLPAVVDPHEVVQVVALVRLKSLNFVLGWRNEDCEFQVMLMMMRILRSRINLNNES